MRRELFHVRYIEVCQSRCQGGRESFARLIQNVDGRSPHISFHFMITIQVITIGEVRVSLRRSPLGDATWGRFFQLAQSQGSVDRRQKGRSAIETTRRIFSHCARLRSSSRTEERTRKLSNGWLRAGGPVVCGQSDALSGRREGREVDGGRMAESQ
jgi:hypothetical protein